MKSIMLLMAATCCSLILCTGLTFAVSEDTVAYDIAQLLVSPPGEYYSQLVPEEDGTLSMLTANMSAVQSMTFFGWDPNIVGAAVKFQPPKPNWHLKKVQVVGWCYFDPKNESTPQDKSFELEIRDSKMDLIYSQVDTRLARFQVSHASMAEIEIPEITVDGEFYVIFYDRGGVALGTNVTAPQETSLFFNRASKQSIPANIVFNGQSASLNWIIRASGN
jgi:hypothetical protein